MAKSIKLKNNTYIDSTGITHNRKVLADIIYPVGSIYISVNSTNPSTYYGGTWERIQDTFLLCAGSTYSAGSTGGEAMHTLTKNEMPAHNHRLGLAQGGNTAGWGLDYTANSPYYRYYSGTDFNENTGGDQPHNNMPPYLAVYVWKRTQ